MGKTILIIIFILIIAIGGYYLLKKSGESVISPNPSPTFVNPTPTPTVSMQNSPAAAREIIISGTEFKFSPSQITLSAGERVKIVFRNEGATSHDLRIEELGIGTSVIGAGQTASFEFTVPITGTFTIYCSVGAHRQAGMEGTLQIGIEGTLRVE